MKLSFRNKPLVTFSFVYININVNTLLTTCQYISQNKRNYNMDINRFEMYVIKNLNYKTYIVGRLTHVVDRCFAFLLKYIG